MNVKITDKDKISVTNPDELYEIMRRILLRDNKIDREKEHFWMIGLNMANIILYIELVSMGSVKSTQVEPMNVFRVAVLKGATSVIALHNHPSGSLTPSEEDKDATDRLIQVGRILDIKLTDHLIITTEKYMSFLNTGLMAQLEKSLKYVPPYLIEQRIVEIRKKQEQELKKEKQKTDKLKETTKTLKIEIEQRLETAVINLLKQKMTIEQIATVLNLSPKEVEKISKKTSK
ncbi:JAB domain-containing protein [Flavobacterium sp. CLA17]|uniref:JAB domain-containing protein n=1 Tax=Flavobacterium sp. CLA17 TaxID=2724135 RepID=UPI001491E435|nr:JAB domain-containing protein [Flavobacterium sp. CLA17]QSB25977.1 DNA repair protein [Flavobacterium sp. CLA17]